LLDDRFDLDASRNKSSGSGTGVGIKQKQETGPMILNITKDLTREIFEEFPVVQDAYARYVPGVRVSYGWADDRLAKRSFGQDTLRQDCGNSIVLV
jgi:transcription initiation factor TFIIH subunit 1